MRTQEVRVQIKSLLEAPSWKARRRRRDRMVYGWQSLYEPPLWGRHAWTLTRFIIGLFVALTAFWTMWPYLLETFPKSFAILGILSLAVPLLILPMLVLKACALAVRWLTLCARRRESLEVFVNSSKELRLLPLEYVKAMRESMARAYGVGPEVIHAADTYYSLTRVSPFSQPFAAEILADMLTHVGRPEVYDQLSPDRSSVRRLDMKGMRTVGDLIVHFYRSFLSPSEGGKPREEQTGDRSR